MNTDQGSETGRLIPFCLLEVIFSNPALTVDPLILPTSIFVVWQRDSKTRSSMIGSTALKPIRLTLPRINCATYDRVLIRDMCDLERTRSGRTSDTFPLTGLASFDSARLLRFLVALLDRSNGSKSSGAAQQDAQYLKSDIQADTTTAGSFTTKSRFLN